MLALIARSVSSIFFPVGELVEKRSFSKSVVIPRLCNSCRIVSRSAVRRARCVVDCATIREEIFLMPDETPIDLLRILIWYDWEHEGVLQLATSRTANTPPGKTVSPIIYSEQLPLNRLLLDWADQKHSLSVRKITRADYLEWMLQWPPRLP